MHNFVQGKWEGSSAVIPDPLNGEPFVKVAGVQENDLKPYLESLIECPRYVQEDARVDWKILGPYAQQVDYIAWVCDQDAYACSGQKCSAQSILFMHKEWSSTGIIMIMKSLAETMKLDDMTIGPVLTVTTESMLEHDQMSLQIPRSKVLFKREPLQDHSIPKAYGAIKPTAVFVPSQQSCQSEVL